MRPSDDLQIKEASVEMSVLVAVSYGQCNTWLAAHAAGVLRLKRRTRIQCTDARWGLMWDRWQKGESLQQIAGPRSLDERTQAARPARAHPKCLAM
jgi:hypothetical protein